MMRAVRGEICLDDNVAAGNVGETCVIRLLGDFDVGDRHRLIDVFCTAQAASDVVVDLSGCSYADFSAFECLIAFHQACQERGARLTLVRPRDAVRELLRVTRMDQFLDVCEHGAPSSRAGRQLTVQARSLA